MTQPAKAPRHLAGWQAGRLTRRCLARTNRVWCGTQRSTTPSSGRHDRDAPGASEPPVREGSSSSLAARRGGEVKAFDEAAGVLGAEVAIHAGVGPVDRQRTVIADLVQRSYQRLPVDTAVAGRAEVPAAARVAWRQATVEQSRPTVERQARILDVDVKDSVGEPTYELDRVDALPVEVARVEGEPKFFTAANRVEDRLGAVQVEGE